MDFLSGLYSNENFGIILFTSISILVLIFLIILFFGKKDKKEQKGKEIKNNDNSEVAFHAEDSTGTVEVLTDDMEPINLQEESISNHKTDSFEEPIKLEEEQNVPVPPKTDFDFDALAASISKELESIGINAEDTFYIENNNKEEKNQNDFELESLEEKPEINLYEAPKTVEPIINVKNEQEMDNSYTNESLNTAPFSSVYVENESEKNETNPEPLPINPNIKLPKTIELPKLNSDAEAKPTPIIEKSDSEIVFPSLEEDMNTYESEDNRM